MPEIVNIILISQGDWVPKNTVFFSALRAESSPMQAFPLMCACLKSYFFSALRAVYGFLFFTRCKLSSPVPSEKAIGSMF